MKKLLLLLAISPLFTKAQDNQKDKFSLSVGGDVAFPTRANTFYTGLGGTLKAAMSVTPKTSITLTSGYISFKGKHLDDGTFTVGERFGPVRLGLQYNLRSQFYLEPQAGYARKSYGSFVSNGSETSPPSHGTFNYAFNIGYLITKNLDISARYEDYLYKGKSQLPNIGLRVAYKFKL